MTENNFKPEEKEQALTSPDTNKSRMPWHSPRLTVLKGSNTEANLGPGADGSTTPGFNQS
jgi:hypothetical protein